MCTGESSSRNSNQFPDLYPRPPRFNDDTLSEQDNEMYSLRYISSSEQDIIIIILLNIVCFNMLTSLGLCSFMVLLLFYVGYNDCKYRCLIKQKAKVSVLNVKEKLVKKGKVCWLKGWKRFYFQSSLSSKCLVWVVFDGQSE